MEFSTGLRDYAASGRVQKCGGAAKKKPLG